MINAASKLYNKLLNIYTTHYDNLSEDSGKRVSVLNQPEMSELDFDKCDLLPLEGDEGVKLESEQTIAERVKLWKNERTGLNILTSNRLLTRFSILLAQIKAKNNLYKLKNEIRQILYLLYEHNKITKKVYNNIIKSL